MRLEALHNLLKNFFDSILDSFIVVDTLAGVDDSQLDAFWRGGRDNLLFIKAVRLTHTAAKEVALIGAFMEFLRGREEDSHLWLGGILNIEHIPKGVDKATLTLLKESANSTIGVQSFRL